MSGRTGLSLVFVFITAVVVVARQDTEPLLGIVEVQADVNAVVCNNKDEKFTIDGSKKPVRLPAGIYRIECWNLEQTDENGDNWELKAKGIPEDKTFKVAGNARTKLPVGEPVVCGLTVKKEDSEFYFRHHLKGRLGEELELTKNQTRPDPPKLFISNEDGSYQESLTFKYG